jgi:hypothetical protein
MKDSFTIVILLVLAISDMHSQGCSDAGICTLPAFRPQKENILNQTKHEFKAGVAFGIGEQAVNSIDPYLAYNLNIKKYRLETRFTYGIRTGNGFSVSDFGDAFIINSFQVSDKVSLSAGVKFPIEVNKQMDPNALLPMAYQSSLGTLDIIAGISLRLSKLQFALAMQQPVKTLNENSFSPNAWPIDSYLNQFPSTNSLDRKADVLLRFSRPIAVNDRFTFSPGILGIYHVDEDEYKSSMDAYVDIEGSAGLTINAAIFLDLKVKENGLLSANLGFPLLVRQMRPDGLTRSFVIGLDYTFSL